MAGYVVKFTATYYGLYAEDEGNPDYTASNVGITCEY